MLYDMENIIEIVSELRSLRTPHQNGKNNLSNVICATPVNDIEIDGFSTCAPPSPRNE